MKLKIKLNCCTANLECTYILCSYDKLWKLLASKYNFSNHPIAETRATALKLIKERRNF